VAIICLYISTIAPALSDPFQEGLQLVQHNQLNAAVQLFTQAIEQGDRQAVAYSNRCLVRLQLEDYSAAIADCSEALRQSPSRPSISSEVYLNRGLAHYRLHHYDDAIADYNRLLFLNRQDFRGYYNRGLSKVALRKLYSALEDFKQAERLSRQEPSSIRAKIFNDWGLALFLQQQWPIAQSKFERAIRLTSQAEGYYFNRGCTCQQLKDYDCALSDFSRAVQLNDQYADAYVIRGTSHALSGEIRMAIADWNRAATLFANQDNPLAQRQIQELVEQVADSTGTIA
ncbi:MAG: tetratricopeptide repeat protein, partial [Cyanobacteria bacterium P01_A01_bin.3]